MGKTMAAGLSGTQEVRQWRLDGGGGGGGEWSGAQWVRRWH